jgi:hypothetical protein
VSAQRSSPAYLATGRSGGRRIPFALTVALGLLCVFPTTHAQDKAAQLAGRAPTPCLDAVAPLEVSEFLDSAARSFVDGVGRGGQLSGNWAPGNQYYDRATAIALEAWRSDRQVQAILEQVNAHLALQTMFRQAAPDELTYLAAFFRTPQGQVFWTYIIDGAHCAGLLQGLVERKAVLAPTQSQVVSDWQSRLAGTRRGFGAAFDALTAEQKTDFARASKLFTRISKYDASVPAQLRPFATQIQSAMKQSVSSVSSAVMGQVTQFKATN